MKKTISLILVLVLCLSLCACGKSEAVINAETQIASLNSNSTYKEILDVYTTYRALEYDEREKVENIDTLATYCNTINGHFTLTDEMISEIKAEITETTSLGMTGAEFSIMYGMSVEKIVNGWSDWGNAKIASHKQKDSYTYVVYGTVVVADEYGKTSTRNLELSYYAEYDEENNTYKISDELDILK